LHSFEASACTGVVHYACGDQFSLVLICQPHAELTPLPKRIAFFHDVVKHSLTIKKSVRNVSGVCRKIANQILRIDKRPSTMHL